MKSKKQIKVSKEFHWEMSHRLPFHDGLCKNIHGHTYKLRIDLLGYANENGILLDFYDLEKIMRPIIDKLDHSFLIDKQDTEVINFIKNNGFKHEIIPYYSTSENIINYIAEKAIPKFKELANVLALTVRLHETPDAYAEITIDL